MNTGDDQTLQREHAGLDPAIDHRDTDAIEQSLEKDQLKESVSEKKSVKDQNVGTGKEMTREKLKEELDVRHIHGPAAPVTGHRGRVQTRRTETKITEGGDMFVHTKKVNRKIEKIGIIDTGGKGEHKREAAVLLHPRPVLIAVPDTEVGITTILSLIILLMKMDQVMSFLWNRRELSSTWTKKKTPLQEWISPMPTPKMTVQS